MGSVSKHRHAKESIAKPLLFVCPRLTANQLNSTKKTYLVYFTFSLFLVYRKSEAAVVNMKCSKFQNHGSIYCHLVIAC